MPASRSKSKSVSRGTGPKAFSKTKAGTLSRPRLERVPKTRPAKHGAGSEPARVEVTYKGRVQGVGFRFNVEKAALACGVSGWVRNEQNGDVQMVAEGAKKNLLELLEAVRKSPVGRFVAKERIRWERCTNEFCDFRIEYHF